MDALVLGGERKRNRERGRRRRAEGGATPSDPVVSDLGVAPAARVVVITVIPQYSMACTRHALPRVPVALVGNGAVHLPSRVKYSNANGGNAVTLDVPFYAAIDVAPAS